MQGRIPPHSEIAEQSLLGAMILDAQAIDAAMQLLTEDSFYNRANGMIFGAINRLYNENKVVDIITLSDHLNSNGKLEAIGGIAYLNELTDKGIITTNAASHAKIVDQKYTLRQLIRAASQISEQGYAEVDASALIEQSEKLIFDISQRRNREGFTAISEVLNSTLDRVTKLHAEPGELTGLTTDLIDLDRKTAGLQKSDLVLLAARPSMGKTALGLNICRNAALKAGATVAMFSLEMAKERYVERMLAAESMIPLNALKTGQMEDKHWDMIIGAVARLSQTNIYIDDTPAISVSEIRAKCRRLQMEQGIDLVLIDYMQLMTGTQAENRQQEISNISRGLKALARELDCPVLALSQLSRAPEQRADHRPMLSDLRESGAIEQDADIVMFLYRDEYYNKENSDAHNQAELIIAKHRNGETGTVNLHWLGQYQLFTNLAQQNN